MDRSLTSTAATTKHSLACSPLEDVQIRIPVINSTETQIELSGEGCTFSLDGVSFAPNLKIKEITENDSSDGKALSFFIRPAKPSIRELNFEVHTNSNNLDGHIDIIRVPRVKVVAATNTNVPAQLRLPDPTVIIYTTAGQIGPESLPLRSEMVAKELAARGETVLYTPTARVANPGPVQVQGTGILFQLGQDDFLANIDNILRRSSGGLFICSSKSDAASLRAIGLANLQQWRTVYEVRDDLEAMRSLGFAKFYDPSIELAICRLVNKIIVVSEPISHKFQAWGVSENKIHVIPNGVSAWELEKFNTLQETDREKKAVYFGHLFPGRFDYTQIQQLAKSFTDYEFRLYGPGYDAKNINLPDNVSVLGQVTPEDFFAAESNAEIGLLPFRANAMTFSLSPLKLAQYYALGLKIVSSDVFQIRKAPLIFSDNNISMTSNFQSAISHKIDKDDLVRVENYLIQNQWKSIVEKTLKVVGV